MAQKNITIKKPRPRRVILKVSRTLPIDWNEELSIPAACSMPVETPRPTAMQCPVVVEETAPILASEPEAVEQTRTDGPIPMGVMERLAAGANIIQAWREHLGLKPKDVAGRMGVVPGVFEQYERWGSKTPAKTKSRIATALGIAPEQLEF